MASRRKKPAQEKLREQLSSRAEDAMEVLLSLMQDETQKPELRMKAAESVLDRVLGKGAAGETKQDAPVTLRFEGVLEEWSR